MPHIGRPLSSLGSLAVRERPSRRLNHPYFVKQYRMFTPGALPTLEPGTSTRQPTLTPLPIVILRAARLRRPW
jgi:hypothetical protein